MLKRLYITLTIFIIALSTVSCEDETQNLDIKVNGRVTDQLNFSIPNTTIYIQRGKIGNFAATVYYNYETVTTDAHGEYKYTIKDDSYDYRICCSTPDGYTSSNNNCQDVNQNIIKGKTVPNVINFIFVRNTQ